MFCLGPHALTHGYVASMSCRCHRYLTKLDPAAQQPHTLFMFAGMHSIGDLVRLCTCFMLSIVVLTACVVVPIQLHGS